jgi:hypothetical protein
MQRRFGDTVKVVEFVEKRHEGQPPFRLGMDRPAAMKRGDGTTWHAPRDEPAGRAREKR